MSAPSWAAFLSEKLTRHRWHKSMDYWDNYSLREHIVLKCTISFVNGVFCHTLDNCFATKSRISWYTLTNGGIGSDGYTSANQHEIDINPCRCVSLTFHHFCIGSEPKYRCCCHLNTRDGERSKCFFRRQCNDKPEVICWQVGPVTVGGHKQNRALFSTTQLQETGGDGIGVSQISYVPPLRQ